MVQKSTARSPSSRGRPPAFDRTAVLAAAQRAFFRTGFEATTLQDLESETGVERSTLYNSFGGKAGVYAAAIGDYLDHAQQRLFGPLRTGSAGLADVDAFLDRFQRGMTRADAPRGCLVVNDMASQAGREGSARYLALVEESFAAALGRAADRGEIAPTAVAPRARLLTLGVVGVNLLSKSGGSHEQVAASIDAMRQELVGWREEHTEGG